MFKEFEIYNRDRQGRIIPPPGLMDEIAEDIGSKSGRDADDNGEGESNLDR